MNFIEVRPLGMELFHADRQTDGQTWRRKSPFSQFCERV